MNRPADIILRNGFEAAAQSSHSCNEFDADAWAQYEQSGGDVFRRLDGRYFTAPHFIKRNKEKAQ